MAWIGEESRIVSRLIMIAGWRSHLSPLILHSSPVALCTMLSEWPCLGGFVIYSRQIWSVAHTIT